MSTDSADTPIPDPTPAGLTPAQARRYWYGQGLRNIISVPAIILMVSFVGFGAFCREIGLSVGEAAFTTLTVWALPSQVVMAAGIAAGSSLGLIALSVTLASVRLTPMVAAWVPIIRNENSSRLSLVCLSQFVAITAWIVSMTKLPTLPRHARAPYFLGFASSLTITNTFVTIAAYELAGSLPELWRGMLFFLTPMYFLASLTGAAKLRSDQLALLFGLVIGPIIYRSGVELDLLWTGLLGGTLAFGMAKLLKRFGRSV